MILTRELLRKSTSAVCSYNDRLVVIVGPTASGKTQVALSLAGIMPAEIICADSQTLYRGMDIGTAKPTLQQQARVVHHGLDLLNPGEKYSVAKFVKYSKEKIGEIWDQDKTAIIVGGSGLYIDALLYGYKFRDTLRSESQIKNLTNEELIALAKKLYPSAIDAIDVKNTRRLQQLIIKGPSSCEDRQQIKYDTKIVGISLNPSELQIRIEMRTQKMLEQGFVQECERLKKRWGSDCPTFQATGYSAVFQYLDGVIDEDAMRLKIIRDTRRLAKKQLTWFRRNPIITWCDNEDDARRAIISYLADRAGTI